MARKSRKNVENEAGASQVKGVRTWRTAIYARLSIYNNGKEDDVSLRSQVNQIADFVARAPDLAVAGTYIDNGHTGTNFERPEFQRLMDDVRRRNVDCIVVKDLSRLGRDHVETGNLLENVFPFLGVRFIAVNDNLDTFDPARSGSIMVPMKNIVNEAYSRDLSRKVQLVKGRMMERGELTHGIVAYGYVRDPDDETHLLVDEATAPYVKLMFKLRLEGLGSPKIADELNAAGAPTPGMHRIAQSKKKNLRGIFACMWEDRHVRAILRDSICTGELCLRKSHTVRTAHGTKEVKLPEEEWLRFPNNHEAIVSKADFDAVQQMRIAREKRHGCTPQAQVRKNLTPSIFVGITFCGVCGAGMMNMRCKTSNGGFRGSTLRCSTNAKTGACVKNDFDYMRLRMVVADQLRMQLTAGLGLRGILASLAALPGAQDERHKLEKRLGAHENELARLRAKRRRLYEDYSEGRARLCDYKAGKIATDDFIAREERSIHDVKAALAAHDALFSGDAAFEGAIAALDDIDTFSEELMRALVRRITIHPGGSVNIEFRFGDWMRRIASIEKVIL